MSLSTDNKKGKQIWKDDNDYAKDDQDSGAEDMPEEDAADVDDQVVDVVPQNKRAKATFEFTVKIQNLPYKYKKKELKEFFKPVVPISLRLPKGAKGFAFVSFKTQQDLNKALIKHKGFLNGHRILITRHQVKGDKEDNSKTKAKNDDKEPKWKKAQLPSEGIEETGRIYVRNLSYTCTEDDLRQLFDKFGVLTELHLPIDATTKKIKGFAFVTFMFPEHAVQAFNNLDKTDFQGRLLHLLPAHVKAGNARTLPPPKTSENGEVEANPSSKFKDEKKQEQRKEANNPVNWNSLFIRPNAVADIMSKRFNVNKVDLLTKGSKKDSISVRVALGETQIVQEVRQFLVKHNVCLDSFDREPTEAELSKTVILVKNLPAETSQDEINDLFVPFGLVNRVLLPPYGVSILCLLLFTLYTNFCLPQITAIVEMQEPNEARKAFRKLAYKNFKHVPLYLEWAPANIFDGNAPEPAVDVKKIDDEETTTNGHVEDEDVDDGRQPEENTTIFVKNLNFATDDAKLKQHFATIGRLYSAQIAQKKSSKGILSMGYGFVQYYSKDDAKEAMKRLQNSQLDDHKLELKFSNRTTGNESTTPSVDVGQRKKKKGEKEIVQTGTKICVKNIPFEATEKDIEKLFG